MRAFECTGLWWLPQQETVRVVGTLKVAPNGDLDLSLLGGLGAHSSSPISKAHPVILGSVEGSPVGDKVTLTGLFQSGGSFGSSGVVREQYHAERAYLGEHLIKDADFSFNHLTLRLGGLTDWAQSLSGFRDHHFGLEAGEAVSLLDYSWCEPVKSVIPEGTVTLGLGFQSHAGLHERSFREEAALGVYSPVPKSADEFNARYAYPLQNLMTFVCDKPQEVELFSVSRQESSSGFSTQPEIQVIGPRVQPQDNESRSGPTHSFAMLFTLKDVDFSDFIDKWFRLSERYTDSCSIFFGLQYAPPAYIDHMLLSVVQAIHVFYIRRDDGAARRVEEEARLKAIISGLARDDAEWIIDHVGIRPWPIFPTVLRTLVEEHSNVMMPLISNRPDGFINEVWGTLYFFTRRDPEARLVASHGAELYWTIQKLRFLLSACFLSELGFSKQKIAEHFNRSANYKHICGLEATRESLQRQS